MRQWCAWLFALALTAVLDHAWVLCRDAQSAFTREAQTLARVDPPAVVLSASGVLLTPNSGSHPQADRPVPGQQAVVRQGAAAPGGPPPPRDFSGLAGPYLGQAPPGTIPQVFAPNAVSTTARELNSVFTPDGHEFYFTIQGEGGRWTIMRSALEHGRWTAPTPASFSGKWSDVDLFITADGRQLYFCSNRPVQGDAPKDFDIWVSDRAGAGWSEPRNLGAPINSPAAEFYPTLTRDGTMYFQSQRPGGRGAADIWRARRREGRYVEAECLPGPVNTSGFEGDAFIAPDGSYLIVSTRVGSLAPSAGVPTAKPDGVPAQAPPPPPAPPPPGLFLSVPRTDGTWSALVSLGDAVNSAGAGVNCQMLSPDGRYLFFTRGGDIYWVDAAVVEQAKRRALEAGRGLTTSTTHKTGRASTAMKTIRMEEMTWPAIRDAVGAGCTTAVVAVGATEQHGPHLPTMTDARIGDALAELVARKLGNALVARTIDVGISDHHLAFGGTVSLQPETLAAVLRDYVASLVRSGFRRIVFVPTHGGNFPTVQEAIDAARGAHPGIHIDGYTDLLGFAGFLNRLSEEHGVTAEASGAHAGESETSMMLALESNLVVSQRLEPGYLGPLGAAEVKRILERGMPDLTANGVLGDPRGARAERGVTYLERLAEFIVEHLEKASGAES